MPAQKQSEKIRAFLLVNTPKHPRDIVAFTAEHFDVTRTTVHRHLNKLLLQNLITKTGSTKAIYYYLSSDRNKKMRLQLTPNLDEHTIWQKIEPDFSNTSKTVYTICEYGFTEMLNNAIDHSRGTWVEITTQWETNQVTLKVKDNGVGLFSKIQQYFNLAQIRESILEISKGKVTTDPNEHTGEGVFFTSKAFDVFTIESDNIAYTRDNIENDWFIQESKGIKKGTLITMQITLNAKQNLLSIFKAYQNTHSLSFNRTEITVALSKIEGERNISRSQAKRILRGLDKFEIIVFDFKGVEAVGQGFVDEIFRVFKLKQPQIELKYINANEDVLFMIKRGIPT